MRVIEEFYRNFHSLRFVNGTLVIRLNKELSRDDIAMLEREFPDLHLPGTEIVPSEPLPEEHDEPDLSELPRLALQFNRLHYGLLMAFIRRINTL